MKFLGFSKSGMKFLSKLFFRKKKKNFENNFGEKNLSPILENPKNFMISFFIPLSFRGKNSSPNFHFLFQTVFSRVFRFFQK